jgi:hypothetical protein
MHTMSGIVPGFYEALIHIPVFGKGNEKVPTLALLKPGLRILVLREINVLRVKKGSTMYCSCKNISNAFNHNFILTPKPKIHSVEHAEYCSKQKNKFRNTSIMILKRVTG